MAAFRKIIFWLHLIAGLATGVVVAIMAATGIAIAFEEETLEWFDRHVSRVTLEAEASSPKLSVDELRSRLETEREGFRAASIVIYREDGRAWDFSSEDEGPLYVDPFTAAVRESRAHEAHEFIHKLEEWHRWLGATDGQTSVGRLVTGISNLALVVLVVTGLYLWFPRRWSWRAVRPIIGFVFRYKGKARDFNWHNVIGIWSLPVVLVLAVTAVAISFEWGHRLVFTLAGEEAPKSRNYGMMAVAPPVVPARPVGTEPISLADAFSRVAEEFPEWESISLEIAQPDPAAGPQPLDFGVTVPDHMPSRAYIPVKSDPFTGEILQKVHFEDRSPGLQARVWIRFLHTGGAFGLTGKIVASLGSLAALFLVWTGFALSWRRFFPKRRRPVQSASGA